MTRNKRPRPADPARRLHSELRDQHPGRRSARPARRQTPESRWAVSTPCSTCRTSTRSTCCSAAGSWTLDFGPGRGEHQGGSVRRARDPLGPDRLPDLFLRLHPQQIAIDEAQLVPTLFPALRVAIDQNRGAKGRFVVTGSSSPHLLTRMSESLAGRVALMELSPLAMAEAWQLPPSRLYTTLAGREPIPKVIAAAQTRLSLPHVFEFWFHEGYPEP